MLLPFILSIGGSVLFFISGIRQAYALLSFTLGLFVMTSILLEFSRGAKVRKKIAGEGILKALWMTVNRNKRRYGGFIVHVGIVMIFVGITGSAFKVEKQATVKKGESFNIKNYILIFF